ncbi:TolC family outer membrane protein [Paucibacter soli]|uniref:TolC family outer membrane protein n=1 Tax=Paucibacter soli TaxID=3133433 RepID=UPI00309F3BEB
MPLKPIKPLLLALLAACALPGPAGAEDLLQVYAQARTADPLLAGAVARRGVQRELAAQAAAALLPQWSLSHSEIRYQGDGGREQRSASSLKQVLLDLGKLEQWSAERSLVSAEEARVQAAEQALCARVASAYFGVLSAQAALRNAEANEAALAQQVQQAQKRFKAGLSAAVDVEQARTYHQLSRGASIQAQESLADARQALAEITGQQPGTLQALAADLQAQAPDPQAREAWVARALQANPALRAQDLTLQSSEQRIKAAGAAHLPTISLGVDSMRRQGSALVPADAGRQLTQVGLQLNIPLFAGGATESAKRQAVYQRDAAREQLEAARRALVRETEGQYQAVRASMALLQSTEAAVQAANQALASTRAGQALGTRGMTDLLLAIQSQTAAQGAHEQARHRYVLATLLLQQAAGQLGEATLATVNQLLQSKGES